MMEWRAWTMEEARRGFGGVAALKQRRSDGEHHKTKTEIKLTAWIDLGRPEVYLS